MLSKFLSPERRVERLSQANTRTITSLAKQCAKAIIEDPRTRPSGSGIVGESITRWSLLPGAERDDRPNFQGTNLKILHLFAAQEKNTRHRGASVILSGDAGVYPRQITVALAAGDYFPAAAGIAQKNGFLFKPRPNDFVEINKDPRQTWSEADAKVRRIELSAAAIVALSVSEATGADLDAQFDRMTKLYNKWNAFLGEEPVAEGTPFWLATPPAQIEALLAQPEVSAAAA